MRIALQNLAKNGATVLVSSHILSELAEMCSSLCVMNQGELLASGTADEVRNKLGSAERTLTAIFSQDYTTAASWLSQHSSIGEIQHEEGRLRFVFSGTEQDQINLLRELANADLGLKALEEGNSSFEDILVKVAEGNHES